MESYVSSLARGSISSVEDTNSSTIRAVQQSKLNTALKGITDAICTYTEDSTNQNYGVIQYYGPISNINQQVITGTPTEPIEVFGTVGNAGQLWLGNLQPNGLFIKNDAKLYCCENICFYEVCSESRSSKKCCTVLQSYSPANPYFPSTQITCYDRKTFSFVSCCEGAVLTNTGFCEKRDYVYPVDTDYSISCIDICYRDPDTSEWIYDHTDFYTTSCWRNCYVNYMYTDYVSEQDFSSACIQVYQKYKKLQD